MVSSKSVSFRIQFGMQLGKGIVEVDVNETMGCPAGAKDLNGLSVKSGSGVVDHPRAKKIGPGKRHFGLCVGQPLWHRFAVALSKVFKDGHVRHFRLQIIGKMVSSGIPSGPEYPAFLMGDAEAEFCRDVFRLREEVCQFTKLIESAGFMATRQHLSTVPAPLVRISVFKVLMVWYEAGKYFRDNH
jgi:hypothetical protein